MSINYITQAVRDIIGAQSNWIEAPHPVEESEVRRMFQGAMDMQQKFRRERSNRYGKPIAPIGFAVHMFRRPLAEAADPFDVQGDPDFDGISRRLRDELPRVPIPLPGVLNGGYEHEFYSYACIGDRVLRQCRYKSITQRDGKTGPVVLVTVEDDFVTIDGRPLQRSSNTHILR